MAQPNDVLAVLVDADNVPPSKIGAVVTEVARFGNASVKRVYGNWTKLVSALRTSVATASR